MSALRIQYHLCVVLVSSVQPVFDHEKTSDYLKLETFYKTNGSYSLKMSVLKKTPKIEEPFGIVKD